MEELTYLQKVVILKNFEKVDDIENYLFKDYEDEETWLDKGYSFYFFNGHFIRFIDFGDGEINKEVIPQMFISLTEEEEKTLNELKLKHKIKEF